MVKCAVCEKDFASDRQLHAHIKVHKMRMVEYYQTHHPRHDKYDDSIIKFKNKKQYYSTDFNSRENLRNWLKETPPEVSKKYCKDILADRKSKKDLIYSPSQVELRTLLFPPIQHYNKIFGDYYSLCKELEYKNKFTNVDNIVLGEEYDKEKYKIFIDTREQKPLKFERAFRVRKLKFGDYAFSDKDVSCNSYIERKSIVDFVGTISGGFERFQNEINRAKEADAYLVIVVEKSLSQAMSFPELKEISSKIKATPEFIFHRVRSLIQDNDHIQFLFTKDTHEASRVTEKIFTMGCLFKKIDLQLAYDKKIL